MPELAGGLHVVNLFDGDDAHTQRILTAMLLRMFEFSPIAIAITTSNGADARYLKVNQAYLDLIGERWEDIRDLPLIGNISVVNDSFNRRNHLMNTVGGFVGEQVDIRHSSGRTISTLISAQRTLLDGIAYDLEIIVDISERTRLQSEQDAALHAAARTDSLSGLANRRAFDEHLATRVQDTTQLGPTLALIDLDGFKSVNDSYGHGAGDALIRIIGERLRSAFRGDAFIARTGGDEFVVIIEDEAKASHEALRQRIEAIFTPILIAEERIDIHGSVGIATHQCGEGVDEFIARADKQMYARKLQFRRQRQG